MLFFEICELCISFSSCMYIGFYLTNTRQENFHYSKNIIALTSFCIMLWILGYNPLVNGYNTQDSDLFCQINGKKKLLNPISTRYLHCFNQISMCVQPKLNHVSTRYQRYFNKKSTNFQRLLNQNINHVSTNYHRFFNQFSTSIQRWYLTLKQRWSFNVASTFISNQNSTLIQRWGATLIQRWFNVEMPAGVITDSSNRYNKLNSL